jgi:hypothetical protein
MTFGREFGSADLAFNIEVGSKLGPQQRLEARKENKWQGEFLPVMYSCQYQILYILCHYCMGLHCASIGHKLNLQIAYFGFFFFSLIRAVSFNHTVIPLFFNAVRT